MSPPKTKKRRAPALVRRSFALPARLLEQVSEAAPPEYAGNLNATVRTALEEYVKRHGDAAFEREMDEMAADPWIRAVNAEIFRDFERIEGEGLPPP